MQLSKGRALKTQITVNNTLYHIVVIKFIEIGYTSVVFDDYGDPILDFPNECWHIIQQLREKLE